MTEAVEQRNLPISEVYGVGPKYTHLLNQIGIMTIGDYIAIAQSEVGLSNIADYAQIPKSQLLKWYRRAQLLARHRPEMHWRVFPMPSNVRGFCPSPPQPYKEVLKVRCPLCSGIHSYEANVTKIVIMYSRGPSIAPLLVLALTSGGIAGLYFLRRITGDLAFFLLTGILCVLLVIYFLRELSRGKRIVTCKRIFLCPIKNELYEATVTLFLRHATVTDIEVNREPMHDEVET